MSTRDRPFTGVLLYDGDCPFCSAASTAICQLEAVADAIRLVSGVDREIDPSHDDYPLTDAALERFDDLAGRASETHVPRN